MGLCRDFKQGVIVKEMKLLFDLELIEKCICVLQVQDDVKQQIIKKKLVEWTVPHHHGSTFRPFYLVSKPTQDMEID